MRVDESCRGRVRSRGESASDHSEILKKIKESVGGALSEYG